MRGCVDVTGQLCGGLFCEVLVDDFDRVAGGKEPGDALAECLDAGARGLG